MGIAKAELIRQAELEASAMQAAIKAGAVVECEFDPGVFISQFDADAEKMAYAVGTNMLKNGEVNATRQEFMDAIKAAMDDTCDECPACADRFSE